VTGGCQPSGELEQERALPDPRVTAEENDRARNQAAAEDSVELADAAWQARRLGTADPTDRRDRGGTG
jgi:hypothetical protein